MKYDVFRDIARELSILISIAIQSRYLTYRLEADSPTFLHKPALAIPGYPRLLGIISRI